MELTTLELPTDLPGLRKLGSGKVRELYAVGENLLFVATDRISAYDCILPTPIPGKGELLTQLSEFWFNVLDFCPNHLLTTRFDAFPSVLHPFRELLEGRSMLVRKASPLMVECVVRGYLAGSGWTEYQASGTVGGHSLPPGLRQADALPEPLFTPSTKATSGHDENISWKECRHFLGDELAIEVRERSLELYEHGRDLAASRGLIIADTKFEFGLIDGELALIDEVLTPDSSRFWPADSWHPGENPPSFDKQFVRDYLSGLDWDKTPPAPELPADIVEKTAAKYREAFATLTGRKISFRQ
jgi:phosphoribosylaminoimidazole-succinocarboxamide synthase